MTAIMQITGANMALFGHPDIYCPFCQDTHESSIIESIVKALEIAAPYFVYTCPGCGVKFTFAPDFIAKVTFPSVPACPSYDGLTHIKGTCSKGFACRTCEHLFPDLKKKQSKKRSAKQSKGESPK